MYTKVEGQDSEQLDSHQRSLGPVHVSSILASSPQHPHYFTVYLRLAFYPCHSSCVLKYFPWTIDLKYEIICLTVTVLWVAGSAEQCTALLSLCFWGLCLIAERWFITQNSIPRHQDCRYCSSEVSLQVRSSPHCVEMDLQHIWGAL